MVLKGGTINSPASHPRSYLKDRKLSKALLKSQSQPLILSMKKPVIQQRFKILLLLYINAQPVQETINTMFFYKSMRNSSGKQITYAHTAITHLLQCHSAPNFGLQTIMQVDRTLHISLVYIYQHRVSCITLKHQNCFRKYLIRNVHIKDSKKRLVVFKYVHVSTISFSLLPFEAFLKL